MQVILVFFIALLLPLLSITGYSSTFCQSLHTLIKDDKANGMDKKIVAAEINLYDDRCSEHFY